MPRLSIDTKKSLYEPIEVEIDGKIFEVQAVDRAVFRKMNEFDEQTKQGNLEAAYQKLELLIGRHKFIESLKLEELAKIHEFINSNLLRPPKAEKNSPGPGDKKLQS